MLPRWTRGYTSLVDEAAIMYPHPATFGRIHQKPNLAMYGGCTHSIHVPFDVRNTYIKIPTGHLRRSCMLSHFVYVTSLSLAEEYGLVTNDSFALQHLPTRAPAGPYLQTDAVRMWVWRELITIAGGENGTRSKMPASLFA